MSDEEKICPVSGNPQCPFSGSDGNSWGKWQKFVLAELERLAICQSNCEERIERKMSTIGEKIDKVAVTMAVQGAVSRVKTGVIGAIGGGLMSIIIGVAIWLITKK